jgi:hypothetical protein
LPTGSPPCWNNHHGLGVYILVLANAAYEKSLWAQLAPALATRHAELAEALTDTLRHGEKIAEPDDDVMVFLKLNMIGFDHLGRMESRRAGPWEVMFNPIRALRPPRSSGQAFEGLCAPSTPLAFISTSPSSRRKCYGKACSPASRRACCTTNSPSPACTACWFPSRLRELPQTLTPELHGWAWHLCAQSGARGLCLGYNSHGAGASVNHLHFQSFVQADPLPVQDPRFAHNGGSAPYPLPCKRFTEPADAWFELDRLHQRRTSPTT